MLQDEKKQTVQLKNLPDSTSVKVSELLNQQQCFHNLNRVSAQCRTTRHWSDTIKYKFLLL